VTEKTKPRKIPPQVGTRLTVSEWNTWCHNKAYCFIQGDKYAVMFCPLNDGGEVNICFFRLIRGEKGEIKEVEKIDVCRFRRSEVSKFLGGLDRLHEQTRIRAEQARDRLLESQEEGDS